jgi:UDP-N-acetylglucosamine--N-acetylmuramyl-(pentapeptide) pyrophosphoryl-undecaprenol N-acetylglucosamine transferase
MSSPRTILIMAGGTGGHIFPALAVAKELAARGWIVVWLGARGKMEAELVPRHGFQIVLLPIGGVRGQGIVRKLVQPFEQARALLLAMLAMQRYKPAAVVGFGGFTGFPGGVAARLMCKPLVVHEQNSVAGLTNRVLAKFARKVLVGFPSAFEGRGELVGNPVRADISALPVPAERFAGRSGPLRLLIVGGSLGAAALNEIVPKALALLPEGKRPRVTHQAGSKHVDTLRQHYMAAGVVADCVPFIDDMTQAYGSADLLICRAGALTLAELAAAGVGAILVPFPFAVDDHQTGNAAYLADVGAAILIQQKDLSAQWLADRLRELDRPKLLAMAEKARARALPRATETVADIVEGVAR